MNEATVSREYPFLLGQPLVEPAGPVEFLGDEDIGKTIYVIAYNDTQYIKFSGTLESYDSTTRSIRLNPCRSLNADGTVLSELPPQTSFSDPTRVFGYEFPTHMFAGFKFRASRTSIPTLYALSFKKIVAQDPSFHENPVVRGGKSKRKRKAKKSKKNKRIKQ